MLSLREKQDITSILLTEGIDTPLVEKTDADEVIDEAMNTCGSLEAYQQNISGRTSLIYGVIETEIPVIHGNLAAKHIKAPSGVSLEKQMRYTDKTLMCMLKAENK